MKRIVFIFMILGGVLLSTQATAQSDIGFKRLGASVGYISPEDLDGTLGLGIFADLGTISPVIGLEARLDYWSWSEEEFGTEVSIDDISIGARAKYLFTIQDSSIRPYIGAGLSMHFLNAEVTFDDGNGGTMTVDDSQTELGLDLGGGMATAISPKVDLIGELWYGISDIDQLALRMGFAMKLGS